MCKLGRWGCKKVRGDCKQVKGDCNPMWWWCTQVRGMQDYNQIMRGCQQEKMETLMLLYKEKTVHALQAIDIGVALISEISSP